MPQNFNLIPLSGSPAINGGTTSDYPSIDITGMSRGSRPSIGAFQVSSGGTTAGGAAIGGKSNIGGSATSK